MPNIYEDLCNAYIQMDDRQSHYRKVVLQTIWSLPNELAKYLGCAKTFEADSISAPLGSNLDTRRVGLCSYDGQKKQIAYNDIEYDDDGHPLFGLFVALERGQEVYPKRKFYAQCKLSLTSTITRLWVQDSWYKIENFSDQPDYSAAFAHIVELLSEVMTYDPFSGGQNKRGIGFISE